MYQKLTLTLLLALQFSILNALHIRVSSVPVNTPAVDSLFIAGSFNNWNPGDIGYMLKKDNNGFFININVSGNIKFKFTRGSWATVEGNSGGQFLPDRSYTIQGPNDTLVLTVAGWEGVGTNSTAAANVKVLSNNFWIPQLGRSRRIWIYLPPDYSQTNDRYPVIYMQDGQNLFDNATSFSGEWKVDESLNDIAASGGQKAIIIGIDNGGANRSAEYSPWPNASSGGGDGGKYVDFIVNTLKPHIDSNYRTIDNRENTGIGGSSLGSLISIYAFMKYPATFSKLLLFSPAYWYNDPQIFNLADSVNTAGLSARVYHLIGDQEGSRFLNDMKKMDSALNQNNLAALGLESKIIPGGKHNEALWASQFSEAFKWLFTTSMPGNVSGKKTKKIKIYPNPVEEVLYLDYTISPTKIDSAVIFDMQGKLVLQSGPQDIPRIYTGKLLAGNYLILVWQGNTIFQGRFEKIN